MFVIYVDDKGRKTYYTQREDKYWYRWDEISKEPKYWDVVPWCGY